MSIPFYFAIEENEAGPQAGGSCAQLGCGFHPDGSLRLPQRKIPGAAAVIDDNILPLKAPDPAVLDALAEACADGCFLDFERPLGEIGAAIAVGLRQRLCAKMTVPPALHGLCPEANVQIPGLLCDHWESFVKAVHAQYGERWALEIIPWYKQVRMSNTIDQAGCLKTAVCHYRAGNGIVIYYDTEETIRRKLAIAERYGCQAGIVLYREYAELSQYDPKD